LRDCKIVLFLQLALLRRELEEDHGVREDLETKTIEAIGGVPRSWEWGLLCGE
jgi:hypothetical protein